MTRVFTIAIPNGFNLSGSTAAHTIRWGYYHGAEQAGMEAKFVQYSDLLEVEEKKWSIFWLTYDDYRFLDEPTLKMLRDYPHIVEVNTWFRGMERVHTAFNAPSPSIPDALRRRILESEPAFVWCSAPDAYLGSYEGWSKSGAKVVSLPWACDTERYNWPYALPQFSDVEMAYVGGYRDYKEQQYAERLWPYEDRLKIWGYSLWPRCYQGHLPNEDERILYGQARLCPTLSEPQFYATGDTVERPFKIMGSGGVTVLDMPCYRELFSPEEALIARYPTEYRVMANALLNDDALCAELRNAGHKAVLERHTYKHRVEKILSELDL